MSRSPNPPPPRSPRPATPGSPAPWGGDRPLPPPHREQRPRPAGGRSPQTAAPRPPAVAATPLDAPGEQATAPRRTARFNNWLVWALLSVSGVGGIAGAGAVSLLRIPNLPNCRAIFWPLASAATRLQCADAYADQDSVESLLAAIALVEALPADHPLRSEIDDRVELWASAILNKADQTFNAGELEEAISIVEKIPATTAAADEVSDRIRQWTAIWEQAQSIFQEAEAHLRASRFREAFTAAIKLRSVDNEYWATTRYDELTSLISRTREEVNILANAERLADDGTVDAIVQAIEQAAAITADSYIYGEAQTVIKELSQRLLTLAEEALARQNSAEALEIVGKIPAGAGLEKEIADFRTLADAYGLTWAGTAAGYEAAIVRLQSIASDRPLYGRAQALRQQWQAELEGIAQLTWARQVARAGTPDSLRAAILEAEEVAPSSPRWDETQTQIAEWQRAIAAIEDQPFLDRAQLMALAGDRVSLQAAIGEAEAVGRNSALYDEAQDLIAEWRWQLQRLDNQPILTQAQQLANAGQIPQAIEVASRIPANQAVYDEAQAAIADWEARQQGRQAYQQALTTAQAGTVTALVQAIAIAQGVPQSSPDWTLAQQAANQWSWDLLRVAESLAGQNVTEAIAVASEIAPRTDAYAEAQLRLREWQGNGF